MQSAPKYEQSGISNSAILKTDYVIFIIQNLSHVYNAESHSDGNLTYKYKAMNYLY